MTRASEILREGIHGQPDAPLLLSVVLATAAHDAEPVQVVMVLGLFHMVATANGSGARRCAIADRIVAVTDDGKQVVKLAAATRPWTVAGGHVFYFAPSGGLFVIDCLPRRSR